MNIGNQYSSRFISITIDNYQLSVYRLTTPGSKCKAKNLSMSFLDPSHLSLFFEYKKVNFLQRASISSIRDLLERNWCDVNVIRGTQWRFPPKYIENTI